MNAIIGHTMISYRAPIAVIEPATEFTTAAVSLFKLIIKALLWYLVEYPAMNQIIPAMKDNIS